ncbi:MAG: SoxR reducing system RseC family protein [Woeseiaceae bacterium]|nr:SoxR reducing system RseC family protein [Woeseiaceae bacterium]
MAQDTPRGQVLSIQSGSHGQSALVKVSVESVCPRCAEGRGCGAGLFGASERTRRVEAGIPAGLDVRAGDTVSLRLDPDNVLAAAVIVYGWPLAGAAAGALVAFVVGAGDTAAALSALGGLAAGGFLARARLKTRRCLERFTPVVVARETGVPEPG